MKLMMAMNTLMMLLMMVVVVGRRCWRPEMDIKMARV